MKNLIVLFSIVCFLSICIPVPIEVECECLVMSEPMAIETVRDDSDGFTLELQFQTPELKVVSDGTGSERLWVDMPGTILRFETEGPATPAFTRLIAVPEGHTVKAHVREHQDRFIDVEPVIPCDHNSIRTVSRIDKIPLVDVGEPGWMRWIRVVPVTIYPARYLPDEHRIIAAERMVVDFEFIPDGSPFFQNTPNSDRYWSAAFEELLNSMMLNQRTYNRILPGGDVVRRGSYIIVTDSALARVDAVQDFAEWKRRKGFNVIIEPLYYDGISADEIKDYIQEAYDNWDRPPEFVLLIGDINEGNMHMPSFYTVNPGHPDEWDVTDLPYVLLQGDDYFPDAFIGRISTNSPSPTVVRNALTRVMDHERSPQDFDDPDAFHRATLFAGNYGDGGPPVISPVETMRWLGERLRELDFDVEEFYFNSRHHEDVRNSGPIIESINRGVNIVAYRGWGDARGTHFPEFYKEDLDRLANGPLLPVFTIFNCNQGDFGNDNYISCFGEYSITRGLRNDPSGALVFYGASDLHTSTRFNNALLGGFYYGYLYEGLRVMGTLTLRSKLEVWSGFPHLRESGEQNNYVEFYFHTYNILGDPEVNLYLDPPFILDVNHPETLHYGDSFVEFIVHHQDDRPLRGAIVTVRWDAENQVSILTDNDGTALVPVQLANQEEIEVTVIAHQAAPYLTTIPVEQAEHDIGFSSVDVLNEFEDNRLVTGSAVSLTVTLCNAGTVEARDVSAELTSSFEEVEIIEGSASFGNLPVNDTTTAQSPFRIVIDHEMPEGFELPFILNITDAADHQYQALFRLSISSALISYVSYAIEGGVIDPGQSRELVLTVQNIGSLNLDGLRVKMHTHDNSVIIEDDEAGFGDAQVGEEIDCAGDPFVIRIREGTTPGRLVLLRTGFFDEQDRKVNNVFFSITVGEPDIEDPLGPDSYGYYAYEDVDDFDSYPEAPTYDWIELDPEYEGEGADHHRLADDTTIVMDLPFTFIFYGEEYDTVSICSNGWISFESTWMMNFRNWEIPSPLGPHTMIAPYWEDLVGEDADGGRRTLDIFTCYDEEEGRFIIEWSRVVARTSIEDVTETFEVILYDPEIHQTSTSDGEIVFQYLEVELVDRNEGNYATVGIQDWNHRQGLEITYAALYPDAIDSLRSRRAIKFTTDPPDSFLVIDDIEPAIPHIFWLSESYPNPFNSTTTIEYTLPFPSQVSLTIYNLSGQKIETLFNGRLQAGFHRSTLNAGDLPSGLYFVKLEGSVQSFTRKLMLLK